MKPRILCVDDSRAIRTGMKNWLQPRFEVVSCGDGQIALDLLERETFDLIILDLDMPNLNGEETITELRRRGDQTPVVLLTAESKTSVIQRVMSHGVRDFVLKPCSPDELAGKIASAIAQGPLQPAEAAQIAKTIATKAEDSPQDSPEDSPEAPSEPKPTPAESTATKAPKTLETILIVDDMTTVSRALRKLIPSSIKIEQATSGNAAVNTCGKRAYRAIIIDMDIPKVSSTSLCKQIHKLQMSAALIALYLRTFEDPDQHAAESGFDSYLLKPFDPEEVKAFAETYLTRSDLISAKDNILTLESLSNTGAGKTSPAMLRKHVAHEIDNVAAAACYDTVIFDLTNHPPTQMLADLVTALAEQARTLRMELRVVATGDAAKAISEIDVSVYDNVDAAK